MEQRTSQWLGIAWRCGVFSECACAQDARHRRASVPEPKLDTVASPLTCTLTATSTSAHDVGLRPISGQRCVWRPWARLAPRLTSRCTPVRCQHSLRRERRLGPRAINATTHRPAPDHSPNQTIINKRTIRSVVSCAAYREGKSCAVPRASVHTPAPRGWRPAPKMRTRRRRGRLVIPNLLSARTPHEHSTRAHRAPLAGNTAGEEGDKGEGGAKGTMRCSSWRSSSSALGQVMKAVAKLPVRAGMIGQDR